MNKAIQETAMIPVVRTGNQTIDPTVLWLSQIILRNLVCIGIIIHHVAAIYYVPRTAHVQRTYYRPERASLG